MRNVQHDKMKLGLLSAGNYYANGGFVRAMQDGGSVEAMIEDLPYEVQQVAQAFKVGEITSDEALQAFVDFGFNEDQLNQAAQVLQEIEYQSVSEEVPQGAYESGGFVAQSNLDDEEEEAARRERARINSSKSQSVLGELGNNVKGQLISTLASVATKALFGMQDGGEVPSANPVEQVVMALRSGTITPEQAIEAMKSIGVPDSTIQQVLAATSAPQLKAQAPLQERPSPEMMIANEVASQVNGNAGGPTLPSEQFEHGGMVSKSNSMMMPTAGPLSSIKTKSVNGYNTEEMTLSFDGKALAQPAYKSNSLKPASMGG